METKELYYPQISAQAGSYTFEEGVELEIYSSKSSYYDWAKIRFTSQFRPKLSLKKKDPATIQLGYDGTLEDVFTGFVSGNYELQPEPRFPPRLVGYYVICGHGFRCVSLLYFKGEVILRHVEKRRKNSD